MKKKSKKFSSLTMTPTQTKSAFNIGNFAAHVENSDVPIEALKSLQKKFVKVCKTNALNSEQSLELIYQMFQTNLIAVCHMEHISPKYFTTGLRMMKEALSFANTVALTNGMLESRHNITLLEDRIKILMEQMPITYDQVPASHAKVVEIISDMN